MFQAKYFPALHKKMETQMYDMINNREENILPDPNLEGVGGGEGVILSLCWFFLNNSKMVKAATLPFCRTQ